MELLISSFKTIENLFMKFYCIMYHSAQQTVLQPLLFYRKQCIIRNLHKVIQSFPNAKEQNSFLKNNKSWFTEWAYKAQFPIIEIYEQLSKAFFKKPLTWRLIYVSWNFSLYIGHVWNVVCKRHMKSGSFFYTYKM